MKLKDFFKSTICLITSLFVLVCSFSIGVSAEDTSTISDLDKFFSGTLSYEIGLPSNTGYNDCLIKEGWQDVYNTFCSGCNNDNWMYIYRIMGNYRYCYAINYISCYYSLGSPHKFYFVGGRSFFFSYYFKDDGSYGGRNGNYQISEATIDDSSGNKALYISLPIVNPTNFCYVSGTEFTAKSGFCALGDDGTLSIGGLDYIKTTGSGLIDALKKGLVGLLTGGFDFSIFGSLLQPTISTKLADDFSLLRTDFNNYLNAELSPTLDLGGLTFNVDSDDYRTFITDLSKDTTTSAYWSNVDNSTANNIRSTYKNLQTCFDSSVTTWNNRSDSNDYIYTANYDEDTQQSTYWNTDNYFNDYIRYKDDDTPDVTTTPGGSSSSGSGVGDIIISIDNSNENNNNINIGGSGTCTDNGTNSSKDFEDDIDISTFKSLLKKCTDFLEALKEAYTTLLPDGVIQVVVVGLLAVVVCRIVGR